LKLELVCDERFFYFAFIFNLRRYTKVGAFFYAVKAFDVLERLDPNPEFWEGKRQGRTLVHLPPQPQPSVSLKLGAYPRYPATSAHVKLKSGLL
jgi:hypothetical protein